MQLFGHSFESSGIETYVWEVKLRFGARVHSRNILARGRAEDLDDFNKLINATTALKNRCPEKHLS